MAMISATYAEDKTCRICGTVDVQNANIFDSRNKSLLYKILTTFPITLYETDPLPKNICKKCTTNVQQMYDECQRSVRVQQKWVDNVRVNKPNHPYVAVLNIIEECHQNMLAKIKSVAPDFIIKNKRVLRPDFPIGETEEEDVKPAVSKLNDKPENTPQNEAKTITSMSFDYDPGSDPLSSLKKLGFPLPGSLKQRRSSIKEIQHKLQSNGCTLLVKQPPAHSGVDIKPRIHRDDVRLVARCKYCNKRFPNIRFLAKHQLIHMSVSDRRIFDRKCLEKTFRRGRLIPIDDKKCIRCLNCWKLFPDNRKILEHWSRADCEFYCQICGLEYVKNPKQLREHVSLAHGITYKSSRRQAANIPEVRIINKEDESTSEEADIKPTLPILSIEAGELGGDETRSPPPLVRKPVDPKTKPIARVCELCGLHFPNYQSKNSHMRVHRPGFPHSKMTNYKRTSQISEMPHQLLSPNDIKAEKSSEGYDMPESLAMSLGAEPSFLTAIAAAMHEGDDDQQSPIKKEKFDEEYEATLQATIKGSPQKTIAARKPLPKLTPATTKSTPPASARSAPATATNKMKNTQPPLAMAATAKKSNLDQILNEKLYNCHPCGKKFSSKTDLFQHKRQCQSNNKFACRFCLRAFVTSADLQMHIMLMHKSS